MRDLREDLEPTWRALARGPAPDQGGRVIMFVSALNGEGVTSMAASFAALAARRSEKPVWLLDFDLKRN
ncbi:MAG: sugar kinase, partial [Pseudomonadota bacterium]|nr:sugar kinase [Pseudomonadota bacterium]